jgi:two-component system, OmpR family, sensor histidine kinase KdpD
MRELLTAALTPARLRRATTVIAVSVVSLAAATLVVGYLQDTLGVPNPSAVYLVAVVVTALLAGTAGAVLTSVAAFLLYNYLFTEPRYTLSMHESGVWLSVVLLLFVGIVVGQLAASMRSRAETGRVREREARALFRISRELATRPSTEAALAEICSILDTETGMAAVWIALGPESSERTVAEAGDRGLTGGSHDSAATSSPDEEGSLSAGIPGVLSVLRRTPGDEPAHWVKVHQGPGRAGSRAAMETYRVRIEANETALGSVWAIRERSLGVPNATETRLLSAAADQIGQALMQDRLAAESQAAEIARQSDALKSALLQSVSHDLRTPLATIRAAAGTLAADGLDPAARRESAHAIDREAEYLNRLVTNLLDLSRIEAGVLRAEKDTFELDDVLQRALERLGSRFGERPVEIDLVAPAVEIDPVLLDEAFTNVVENVLRHTDVTAPLRISAHELNAANVRLTVEDGGPGVPDEALDLLFDKFYRAPARYAARDGTGIGLTVVRGLIEAMGGSVTARASELGGLAIDMDLPRASVPAELSAVPTT